VEAHDVDKRPRNTESFKVRVARGSLRKHEDRTDTVKIARTVRKH
jgi:hypothetical protein